VQSAAAERCGELGGQERRGARGACCGACCGACGCASVPRLRERCCRGAAPESAAAAAAPKAGCSCVSGLRRCCCGVCAQGCCCGCAEGCSVDSSVGFGDHRGAVSARAVERGRANAVGCERYERERKSTSMEFAPWGSRPVSCVSDYQCAARGGGGDAPLEVPFVACTLLTGLPDGTEDGHYCACAPFRSGLTCQEAMPVLQLRGFLLVPSALLAVLALWRALRDLRTCPREKRASPGAVCLMLVTCAASSVALCFSCACVVRWTGGNAAVMSIFSAAQMSSAVMAFTAMLHCSLVFECISASADQRTVRQKRWYAFFALFVAAFFASSSKAPFKWQRLVLLAVGLLVVALLWIRAARMLANTLEDFSAGSAPLAEKARVTRDFIQFACRFLALAFGCLSVQALLDINGLSPLPVIVSDCLLEAVLMTGVSALLLRFQDYLGTPFRRTGACAKRSRVRPRPSTDRLPQKPSMLVVGVHVGDARVSGAHTGKVSSGDTLSLAQLESADSVACQRDEVQKPDGAGPRTSRTRDGEPAGCVGVPAVND
jgi:hypothetical protein